jgi:hypothetical protein
MRTLRTSESPERVRELNKLNIQDPYQFILDEDYEHDSVLYDVSDLLHDLSLTEDALI